MKQYLFLFSLALMMVACGGEGEQAYPEDLAGKKALLKEKKAIIRTLNQEVAKLESEIETLQPSQEKSRALVSSIKVGREDFKHFVEIQASVQADETVSASSEVGGRIISMNLKEGQNIRKGQLVAKLDLEQLDKQIAEIEKSLELAQEVYERQKRLWDQDIGSEMQLLQAKNNKERLEKSLETIRFQQTKSNVYAPISGVVDMVMLEEGELASPGMPILQILNTNKIKVVADVPENLLQSVKKGERVKIKFPALDMEKEARVSLIGRTINPANRTFQVEVDLPNGNGLLKPNLLATMQINDSQVKDAVTIPLELVQQEVSGKSFVYVRGEGENGDFAKKVYVTTGESYEGKVVIKEGLQGDEQLLTDGARSLSANELIKIAEAK